MSQTTCCPACQTRFKVVADQLRISDGWVRCGQCQLVFDAYESLQTQTSQPMMPEIDLGQLRAPVTKAGQASAPIAAWQSAGGPHDTSAARAAGHAPLSASALPRDDVEPDALFDESAPPDFENTVPAALWEEPDARHISGGRSPDVPRSTSLHVSPSSGTADTFSEDKTGARSKQLETSFKGRVPDLDASASSNYGAFDRPGEPLSEEAPPKPLRGDVPSPLAPDAWFASDVSKQGYELPGAVTEDDDSGWALFPEPPALEPSSYSTAPTDAPSQVPSSDGPEPDLAHFIAEFTDRQNERKPADALSRDSRPADPSLPSPLRNSDFPEQGEAAMDLGSEPLPFLERSSDWEILNTDNAPLEGFSALEDGELSYDPYPDEDDLAPNIPSSHEDLMFVRRARRVAFWSGWRVRLMLFTSAALLMSLLAVQVALQHRNALSALFPAVRGALVATCEHLRCKVSPYRDIASVALEGSSFNRIQGDRFQFSLTLRNGAALAVETPSIELTLTDVQDQPVIRRVLKAPELSAPGSLPAGSEWSGTNTMSVGPGTTRIAGYRVLAFYPD